LCGSCLGCSSEHSRPGIVVLIESPPDSLDDRLTLSNSGQRIAPLISPGLVAFDNESQPVPDLARDYRLLDPKTLEFTLREGLTFHDGTPLTSEDVKATFDGLISRAMPSPRADKLEVIERIEVLGPLTLRIHLKRPYAPILAELSMGILPRARAVPPAALEQDRTPIGAGPFKFAEQPDEEHLLLLPFEGYYGGKPRISRLLIRTVRDQTTRVLELLKGRADLVVGAVSPSVFPSLQGNPGLQILSRPGTAYAYLGLNSRSGPLADVRIRRAICHAIDVQPIIEAKFHGFAEPATGMLPRSHWAYANTPGCRKDLALAARLLEDAGYSSTPTHPEDAGRPSVPASPGAGGKPTLHLTLKVSTDRFRKSVALIFQEQLAQIGIQLEIRAFEFGTFFNDVRKGNFELASLVWSSVIEPDLLRWAFASANIPSPENSFGGQNRTGYRNIRLDVLLDRATRLEPEERKAVYSQALALIDADLPCIPLWHESSPAIVSSRLRDYEPSPQGFLRPLARAREAVP
jgi:peptide/nickel transport system substrate-binding protein